MATILSLIPVSSAASSTTPASWLDRGENDRQVHAAIAASPDKLPSGYEDNLRYVADDGTIRVMVALARRDPGIEAFVEAETRALHWYGEGPRFYAAVDQDGFAALLNHDAVTFVEPDYLLTYHLATSVPFVNGRGSRGVWNMDMDGARGSLSSNYPGLNVDMATGKDVTVAIVDSGIDKTHRDFGGWDCNPGPYQPCESRVRKSVLVARPIGAAPDIPGDALPTTDFASGHGTHVAGIVAGNGYYSRDGASSTNLYGGDGYVIGMAPQASLVSVKVGDTIWAGLGQMALQWTLSNAKELDIKVANNSWGCANGCPYDPRSVLAQIQRDLYEAGVVTVFAAGNNAGDGSGEHLSGRSQSPYVLSVASYDDETGRLSGFSSRGERSAGLVDPATWTPQSEGENPPRRPDIAAPGDWIDSATNLTGGAASLMPRVNPGDVGQRPSFFPYIFMSGTSMAAPHVSGAAALLFSACPTARPLDVMRAVTAGATPAINKTDGSGPAQPFEVGYGGLDVRASLEWIMARPACNGVGVGRIEGSVVARGTGKPIKKARFSCGGLQAVTTDALGNFVIEDVAAGAYRCKTSAKAFGPVRKTITVEHATTKAVRLEMRRQKAR